MPAYPAVAPGDQEPVVHSIWSVKAGDLEGKGMGMRDTATQATLKFRNLRLTLPLETVIYIPSSSIAGSSRTLSFAL